MKEKRKHTIKYRAWFSKKAIKLIAATLALVLIFTLTGNITPAGNTTSGSTVQAAEVDTIAKLPGRKFSDIQNPEALPDGMLLIGAYLIYDQYLTDDIYNLAVESMSLYNQPIMFYKSELAGGSWIDLSAAVGLTDLQGLTGEIAEVSDLGDYYVCAVVYADGVMDTIGTDRTIFNLSDPYAVLDLQELSAFKLLYDGLNDTTNVHFADNAAIRGLYAALLGDSAANASLPATGDLSSTLENSEGRYNQIYERIWTARLLDTPLPGDVQGQTAMKVLGSVKDDLTDSMDKALDGLDGAYDYYRRGGNQQYMATIVEAMGQADNTRRAEVYYTLSINGAGVVYTYIQNKQYDKLITKEQWAERYMEANWGPNWRYNDEWADLIEQAVSKNTRRGATWSSVNYDSVPNTIIGLYAQKHPEVRNKRGWLLFNYTDEELLRASVEAVKGVYSPAYRLAYQLLITLSGEGSNVKDVLSFKNKIDTDDSNVYSIVYIARDYAWALNQAGDRLGDVRYWAERGNIEKAYQNYLDLMQRTYTTQKTAFKSTGGDYVVGGSGRLNALLTRIQSADDLDEEIKRNYSPDAEYVEALKSAIESCQESYTKYSGRLLEDDSSLLGSRKYECMQYLINNAVSQASGGNVTEDYNQKVLEYTCLRNIQKDIVCEKQNELNMLNTSLLPAAETNYLTVLSAGPSDQYRKAVSSGLSEDVQQKYLVDQKAEVDGILAEYEFLISARIKRIGLGEQIPYIDNLMDTAEGYRRRIASGAFSEKANTSVDEFIEWLRKTKKTILGDSTGNQEFDALNAQKAALEDAYMNALDSGDVDAAEEYKNALADINGMISDIQEAAMDDLNNGSASDASDAENMLGGTSALLAEEIKKKAAEDIGDGDLSHIEDYLSALGDLGATDALNYLKKKLADVNASKTLMNKCDDAIATAANGGLEGNGDDDGSGSGDGSGTGGSGTGTGEGDGSGDGDGSGNTGPGSDIDTTGFGDKDDDTYVDLMEVVEDALGKSFDDMDDAEKAATLTAIDQYGKQNGDLDAQKLAALLLKELLSEGNPFIYQQYLKSNEYDYINLAAIDRCRLYTGYRYVYEDGTDTLSELHGTTSYGFAVGNSTVILPNKTREGITSKAESQSDITLDEAKTTLYPYVVKEDVEKYIKTSCYYIPYTIYAVLIPQQVDAKVEQLLGALEEAFED